MAPVTIETRPPDGPGGAGDPDRLAELEAERSFLLQSLRDLEAERAAGDVDDHDYETLRDGYTKRAADVLRQVEAGRAALPAKRAAPWTRRLIVICAVVAVGIAAGWLMARSSGQRLPGDEITGDGAGSDISALLSQARTSFDDPQRAIELYGQVLAARPDHPEALTYRGWLIFLVSQSAPDDQQAELVDRARQDLDAAVDADPGYADPHCFLAVIASGADDDADTARDQADQCLALDPPSEVRALMTPFIESLPEN
jgi:tetratricopeptide (TPR) repeat protein